MGFSPWLVDEVYDVTNFAKIHPGGPGRIQMAGGSDLQKYFDAARLQKIVVADLFS